MSRWIDVEWLLGVAKLSNGTVDVDDIYNAPSIDICFCRECKHNPWTFSDEADFVDYNCIWDDDFADRKQTPDDYCSYGEREGE